MVAAIGLSGIGGNGGPDDNAAQGGHLVASTSQAAMGPPPSAVVGPLQTGHTPNGHGMAGVNDQAVASGHVLPVMAFGHKNAVGPTPSVDVTGTVRAGGGTGGGAVSIVSGVRRLTPTECERLQGFPDGWTATSGGRVQADAPRYRQLGNSIAVPVFEWVAAGIVAVEGDERG